MLIQMPKKRPIKCRANRLWLEPGLAARFKQPKTDYFATQQTLAQASRVLHLADVCFAADEQEKFGVEAVSKLSPPIALGHTRRSG